MNALNWLIFHDFVPFNVWKVLERQFLDFFLKISKILAWTIFSDFDPKGGPFYARIKKSKKSNFFCSKSHLFSLNMNYTCSKLSFEVSDMPCNQVSSTLTLFYMGGGVIHPPLVVYRSPLIGGCPKQTDFLWVCSLQY